MCRDCDFEYKVCTFFLRGRCIFGKRCRNIHTNLNRKKRKHKHQCTQPCLKNEEQRANRKSIRESYDMGYSAYIHYEKTHFPNICKTCSDKWEVKYLPCGVMECGECFNREYGAAQFLDEMYYD